MNVFARYSTVPYPWRGSGLHGLQRGSMGSTVLSRLWWRASPAMVPHTSSELVSHDDAVRIREALGEVLLGAPFRTTRQCQSFLKYIVEHTLAGENDLLRERVIGTEVFGRSPDYEPSDDPVVRVRAAEVRKRLAQYYQGRADSPVQIDIPLGSYRAVFQWKESHLDRKRLG